MKKEERFIVANWIMCPDGTMLPSFNRHDYRIHEDNISGTCGVDGGLDYLKRTGDNYTEMTVYSDDPFEVIRRFFCRLNVGKDGKSKPKMVPLFMIDDDWLDSIIEYYDTRYSMEELESMPRVNYYEQERVYRDRNTIKELL